MITVSNDLAANNANGSDCHLPPLPPLEMPNFDFDKRNEAWLVLILCVTIRPDQNKLNTLLHCTEYWWTFSKANERVFILLKFIQKLSM